MAVHPIHTIKIFYCYAHEDDDLREQLARHLNPLRRLRYITGWFDRDIQAGTDWEHEIETHLDAASIILLLVSADFVASDYCYTVEMKRALEKHKAGTARVIPIILRPVAWEETPIGELAALPTGKKPVTQWADRDEAWLNVVQAIREVVRTLLLRQPLSSQETGILYPDLLNQPGQSPAIPPAPILLQPPLSPTTQQYKQPLVPSTIHKPALPSQSQRPTRAPIPWLWLRVVAIVIAVLVLTVVSARTILNSLIVPTPTLSPTASISPSSSPQTIPENIPLICNSNCGANIVVTLSSITVGGLSDPTWNFTATNNDTISCGLLFVTPYLLDKDTGYYTPGLNNGTRSGLDQEVSPGGSISLSVSFPGSPSKGTFAFSSGGAAIISLNVGCGTRFNGGRGYQTVTIKIP